MQIKRARLESASRTTHPETHLSNSCVCCSRTRCCALCLVDDDGGVLFFGRWFYFGFLQQYSSRHRKRTRRLRAPSLLDTSGLVRLLLLPATRQAGRACSASCVLFSYLCKNSFDLMTAGSFSHFCSCNFWHQLKSLTIPEAIRHPTRETQEHRVTSTHSAAAPSACGSFKCGGSYCPMCDFLGRMVLLTKRLRSNVCAAARCGSRR